MHKVLFTALIISIVSSLSAFATTYPPPSVMQSHVKEPELVGSGRLSFLFWDVYDAYLYAPKGLYSAHEPFALKLSYLLDLDGEKIADRSIKEMRYQGFIDELLLADWHSQMKAIFPDIRSGDSLIGIRTERGDTLFYKDSHKIGEIKGPDFTDHFFRIWLSPQTSEPALRQSLLGE